MWLCSCQDNYQIYLNTAHAKYMYNMYINLYCHLPSAHTKTNIYHKLACWCLTVWISMRSPFNAWFAHLMPALYSSGINTQWTKYNSPRRRQASIWIFPSGHTISQLFPAYINLQPKNHTRVFGIFGKLPKYNFHPQPTPANPSQPQICLARERRWKVSPVPQNQTVSHCSSHTKMRTSKCESKF